MNVLFISIAFYEYIAEIKAAMENTLSADVDCLIVGRRQGHILESFAGLVSRGATDKKLARKRQEAFFHAHQEKTYDYIFVLVGVGLEQDLFEEFLRTQPQATKILYLWDDMRRVPNFAETKELVDQIWSSDSKDCAEQGFRFLPLFYCDSYRYQNEEKDIDVSVTGSLHSDRQNIIEKVLADFPQKKYKWYARMIPPMRDAAKLLLRSRGKLPFYVSYKTIPLQENAEILKRSKVVLDMPFASQTGLSIRTLEALAARTKLITTNHHVKEYDFYSDANILLIDRDNPMIDPEFIQTPYQPLDEAIVERYSVSTWVNTLFGQTGAQGEIR